MLRNVDPLLPGALLKIMDEMGHGDLLGVVDRNFPAYRYDKPVISLRGIDTAASVGSILTVFPLDSYVEHPILRMEIDGKPDEINTAAQAVIDAAAAAEDFEVSVEGVERFAFYGLAAGATAFVQTGETVGYACYLLKKGVIPGGSA